MGTVGGPLTTLQLAPPTTVVQHSPTLALLSQPSCTSQQSVIAQIQSIQSAPESSVAQQSRKVVTRAAAGDRERLAVRHCGVSHFLSRARKHESDSVGGPGCEGFHNSSPSQLLLACVRYRARQYDRTSLASQATGHSLYACHIPNFLLLPAC